MIDIAATFLFVFGLAPMYVSAVSVEKYFTNFWTAFWNIYGLLMVSVSLGLTVYGTGDLADTAILSLLSVLLCMMLFLALGSGKEWANVSRRLGASWLVSTVSVVMFAWFNTHDNLWAAFAFFGNLLAILALASLRPRQSRFRSMLRY
jgi:hypothetical protein